MVAEWIDSRKLNTRSLRILSYMRGFPYSDFCSAVNAIVFDSAFVSYRCNPYFLSRSWKNKFLTKIEK